jgi:hypothetical protein
VEIKRERIATARAVFANSIFLPAPDINYFLSKGKDLNTVKIMKKFAPHRAVEEQC